MCFIEFSDCGFSIPDCRNSEIRNPLPEFVCFKKVNKIISDYLESMDMKFTFVREINFRNLMDDDPANILILTLIRKV